MSIRTEERESAFSRRIETYAILNVDHIDVQEFLNTAYTYAFQPRQAQTVLKNHFMKTYGIFVAEFRKTLQNGEEIRENLYIQCGSKVIDDETNLWDWFDVHIRNIIRTRLEDFEINGSNWSLAQIIELVIHNNKYSPIRGSSYMELPEFIKSKHAVINIKNDDSVLNGQFYQQFTLQRTMLIVFRNIDDTKRS